MADNYQSDAGNGTGRLDRIEHILELVATNEVAIHMRHEKELERSIASQAVLQNRIANLGTKKIDQQASMQAALDARVDKLGTAIGEFIRAAKPPEQSR